MAGHPTDFAEIEVERHDDPIVIAGGPAVSANPEPVAPMLDAVLIGEALNSGRVERGILVCGSGVGVSVAANKIKGVYAGLCHDTYSAHQGVEHDNANVLCLGERVTGPELAVEIARAYIRAQFSDQERHHRRVGKILAIEADNSFPTEALLRQG